MRLGIDLTSLTPDYNGGKEQFVTNLLQGWRENGWDHELTIFLYGHRFQQIRQWVPEAGIVVIPERHIKFRNLFFRTWELPKLARQKSLDFLLFPQPETGFRRFSMPTAVIPHDIQFIEYPKRLGWYERYKTSLMYGCDFRLRDGIAAISDYDHGAMSAHFPRHVSKMKRIYNPVVLNKQAAAERNGDPFILTVNVGFKHKNGETIVKAFERICHLIPHSLVLAGTIRPETRYLADLVEQSPARSRIQLPGYVSDEQLEDLYQHCTVFVSASKYEGFGMTAVEAMGRLIPVVTSRAAALPEITFESAHYYEPVDDAVSLAQRIMQVIESPPAREDLLVLQQRVMEAYDYRTIAAEYRSWFLEMIQKCRQRRKEAAHAD